MTRSQRLSSTSPTDRSTDARYAGVEATLKRHNYRPDALIEVLHTAQQAFGFLSREVLTYVGRALKLPPSRVYGTATFYHFFTFKPQSEHTCVVCLGTACFVRGGKDLMTAAEDATGLHEGETSGDGKVSLVAARCLGTCGIAPAAVFDGAMRGHLHPNDITENVKGWGHGGPV